METSASNTGLSDQELSDKVEDVFEYLHHMPSDLSFTDRDLLKELKRRFDAMLALRSSDDEELLIELDKVIVHTHANIELATLGKVRNRLFDLTVVDEVTQKDLTERLRSMLSYPDNLSGSDQDTLEEVLTYISTPTKI